MNATKNKFVDMPAARLLAPLALAVSLAACGGGGSSSGCANGGG